jgi:16S rRNA (uracil1498-N3)-methyltransferase
MECIFVEELNLNSTKLAIPTVEAKHLKALRIKPNEQILITNGNGLSAIATVERINKNIERINKNIERINKNDYLANVEKLLPNYGELDYSLSLAIGILDSQDRFEFALEKCVELGVAEVFPLILDYSQHKKINQTRLISKAIAAIKQCKRSKLPTIHSPQTVRHLLENIFNSTEKHQLILADENGENPSNIPITKTHNTIIFVGSEGGFSAKELSFFPQQTIKWNLGNTRLRAETAAIVSVGIFTNFNKNYKFQ